MHVNPRRTGRLRGLLLALALLLAPLLGLLPAAQAQAAGDCSTVGETTTCTFTYSGAADTWTVPVGVTEATFDLYGAGGGFFGRSGRGGRVLATLAVTPGVTYQILVGGWNSFNGGGAASTPISGGSAGGGASDVRLSPYGLAERLLVAGGGGGGGNGGGARGGEGGYPNGGLGNRGGTQTGGGAGGPDRGGIVTVRATSGSLGQGGNADVGPRDGNSSSAGGGGGGGGYYGGGGGYIAVISSDNGGGGGGGSSYATPAATNVSYENGVREDNGLVIITYRQERIPPRATPAQSPPANADGWNNTPVSVSWNWADNPGGTGLDPANCTTASSSSGEGELTLSAGCADLAGNLGRAEYRVRVDTAPPTISAAATNAPNAAGWYANPVPVRFTCLDATSGIAATGCPADQLLSADGAAVSSSPLTATDRAGNTSAPSNVVTVQIDRTAPTISAAATTAPNAAGWYTAPVEVAFSCADALSGLAEPCPPAQTLSADGAAVSSTARRVNDVAGNRSAASNVVTVAIDRTAPTISAAATTAPNASGWYNGDVSVAFSCGDAVSGIPAGACPASQTLGGEGSGISSSAQSVSDLAGNTSAASNIVTVQIDRTAPSVSVTGVTDGASYPAGAVPAAACSSSDALSGVATPASVSVTGGPSSFTATCAGASDNAGNSAPAVSVSYSVQSSPSYRFSGFSAPVDNPPAVNVANAGRTIPLKWRLTDAGGNPVTNLASVTVTSAVGGCSASAPTDSLETYADSPSGLQNLGNGFYQFNWKTERSWRGCRTLKLDLGGGQVFTALFQFR